MAGDILQTRQDKRVVMALMLVITHQGAMAALGVIIARPIMAVVYDENRALF